MASSPAERRAPRQGPHPEQPSPADIIARVGARQDSAEAQADLMAMAMQRIEQAMADGFAEMRRELVLVKDSIGYEKADAYGKPIGEGVVGRLMRMERRLGRYDRWVIWATGAGVAAAVFVAVLWWAWQPKIEAVLR